MISVPADIAGQSKHAADWLDGRKEQGPSPVLARAKRQMEELEVDWADAFAVPETESVTVPRPKKKRTEEPAATTHLPPAISASHTAKPPHPPGKVLAQKTAHQQLLAQAAQRVQRQAEQAKKKEDEAKKKKKEEEEKRKKKEKEEEEKRKKKEKEEEERRKKKEKEDEEKRRKKAEKVMQRALSLSLHVLCISSRVHAPYCACYTCAMPFARRHILSPVKTVRSNLHCKTTLQQKRVGRVTRWMPLTPLGQCKFGCSAPPDPVGRPPAREGVIYAIYHESWMCIRNCKQNLANRGYFRRWSGWIS